MPKRRREPVQECWVVGEQHFLHGGCRAGWEAAPAMQLPSGSKVFGIAPGHRCEHCSSGRDVYLIQLPGEEEAADRHKECAARYWRKMQEVHPDSCARHSSRHDYNCHIGSAEWKRFRSEVIKQRGNRCERCGQVSASLELHHLHYHSLGSEQPEDAELLCPECHKRADEARAAKGRPKHFEPAVLQDGRYVPMPTLKWKGKS
jgi:5-methylcytosine-specific restriction endonuclease McrA